VVAEDAAANTPEDTRQDNSAKITLRSAASRSKVLHKDARSGAKIKHCNDRLAQKRYLAAKTHRSRKNKENL
jgi:hypothetical protein